MHLWAEIMHSVLDSPPGYTALGPADLGAVYPGALLAHRALFGPECTLLLLLRVESASFKYEDSRKLCVCVNRKLSSSVYYL